MALLLEQYLATTAARTPAAVVAVQDLAQGQAVLAAQAAGVLF
jgi:hypothetical protein